MKNKLENKILTIELPEKIDSNNFIEFQNEINRLVENNNFEKLILDGNKLIFIISSGIRTLIKLKKSFDDLEIINTTPQVLEVLMTTGIDSIIPIFPKDRIIDTSNLEIVAENNFHIAYKLDNNLFLRVLKLSSDKEQVLDRRNKLQQAILLGVPSVLPYEFVKTKDNRYGLIYQIPKEFKTFETLILENPEKEDEYLQELVDLTKYMHSIKVPTESPKYENSIKTIDEFYDKNLLSDEERNKLEDFWIFIPERDDYLHGDLSFKNIIKTKSNENLLLDIKDLRSGHPVLDLYRLYYYYYLLPEFNPDRYKNVFKIPVEKAQELVDKFNLKYFDNKDPDFLNKLYKYYRIISLANAIKSIGNSRNHFQKDDLEIIKKELFQILDQGVELITF